MLENPSTLPGTVTSCVILMAQSMPTLNSPKCSASLFKVGCGVLHQRQRSHQKSLFDSVDFRATPFCLEQMNEWSMNNDREMNRLDMYSFIVKMTNNLDHRKVCQIQWGEWKACLLEKNIPIWGKLLLQGILFAVFLPFFYRHRASYTFT